MPTWNKNPESLARGAAIVLSGTYVGEWHTIKGAANLAFYTRMTSAGSPKLAVSIDYSIFEPGETIIPPDDAYQTVSLIAAHTTVWNGTAGAGTFTYTACPAEILNGAVSIRVRAVESNGVAVTAFDQFMTKTTRS